MFSPESKSFFARLIRRISCSLSLFISCRLRHLGFASWWHPSITLVLRVTGYSLWLQFLTLTLISFPLTIYNACYPCVLYALHLLRKLWLLVWIFNPLSHAFVPVLHTGNQSCFVALWSRLDALFIVTPARGSSYRLSLGADVRGALLHTAAGGLGFFLAPLPVAVDVGEATLWITRFS